MNIRAATDTIFPARVLFKGYIYSPFTATKTGFHTNSKSFLRPKNVGAISNRVTSIKKKSSSNCIRVFEA